MKKRHRRMGKKRLAQILSGHTAGKNIQVGAPVVEEELIACR
jgi:hypothetical protein